jgi:hypothetical protein
LNYVTNENLKKVHFDLAFNDELLQQTLKQKASVEEMKHDIEMLEKSILTKLKFKASENDRLEDKDENARIAKQFKESLTD